MTKFTVQCETLAPYRNTVVVEADTLVAACRAGIDAAGDDDGWKSVAQEQSTYIVAMPGDDVDPWTLDTGGADISVIPYHRYSATSPRSSATPPPAPMTCPAAAHHDRRCRDDGTLRIDAAAMQRLCATGKAMLADIDRCGLALTTRTSKLSQSVRRVQVWPARATNARTPDARAMEGRGQAGDGVRSGEQSASPVVEIPMSRFTIAERADVYTRSPPRSSPP